MTSPTKFYHVTQIILQMWSCDQSLVTLAFLQPQFYRDLTRKTNIFEECSWLKFNNLGLALGMALKFYTSVAKGLRLKVRNFWGLILTFVEVTGEKLVGGAFLPPILYRALVFVQSIEYWVNAESNLLIKCSSVQLSSNRLYSMAS